MTDYSAHLGMDEAFFRAMPISVLRFQAPLANAFLGELSSEKDSKDGNESDKKRKLAAALAKACVIQFANDAASQQLQFELTAASFKSIGDLLDQESYVPFTAALERLSQGERATICQVRLKSDKGDPVVAVLDLWQSEDSGQLGSVYLSATCSTKAPISKDSLADKSLTDPARSARIGLLSEMTASIAHEVNQPLGSIVTSAEAGLQWLNRDEPDLSEIKEILLRIAKSGKRAASVVSTMRAMASNRRVEYAAADINDIIEEAVALLRTDLLSRQISLELDLAPQLPLIEVDRIQVLQVITNLASNAAHAMSDVKDRNRTLRLVTTLRDDCIAVQVEDNGPGIDPTIRESLFDSFVTTKETGIGVGLTICRAIISAHGGEINLLPSGAQGARFRFTLPTDGLARQA